MAKPIDRSALKLEFFNSPFDEVEAFFRDKWKTWTDWNTRKNTKWRSKEKQEMKERIVQKAIERNAERQAKELAIPLEDLMKWKKAIIWLLLQQVKKYVNDSKDEKWNLQDIDVWNAEKILKMFKTELWEPSTIWTNYNLNANKVEWLNEEELQALDLLFSWKSQNWKKSKE